MSEAPPEVLFIIFGVIIVIVLAFMFIPDDWWHD